MPFFLSLEQKSPSSHMTDKLIRDKLCHKNNKTALFFCKDESRSCFMSVIFNGNVSQTSPTLHVTVPLRTWWRSVLCPCLTAYRLMVQNPGHCIWSGAYFLCGGGGGACYCHRNNTLLCKPCDPSNQPSVCLVPPPLSPPHREGND